MKPASSNIPSVPQDGTHAATATHAPDASHAKSAAPDAQAAGASRSSRGTVRGRLAQLLNIKKVQHEPAVSVAQWNEAATLEICERWAESQRVQPSIVGLSRLMALNFERARPDAIPPELEHQRLLPKGSGEDAYYQEMIATFLKTVGLDDTDAVIDSFKKAGTGSLHRQHTTAASVVSGAFSVAQLAASANLPAKTALSAVQALMTGMTTQLGFKSADLRFRNSGTEEVMPLGKADASPSAKTGPNVMQAATRVAWDLGKARQAVRKMERAQADLDDAHARLSNPGATEQQRQKAEKDLHTAGQALSIAYARFCMRAQLKSDYKTASESAKIEYRGNQRALGVSVATGAASMTATVLGILTPVVVSATVTAGATAAAVALAATLYVGYQLSAGPSKDGEAKAKRAIVALAKSLDLLAGNAGKQQSERSAAYRTYIAEKRVIGKPEVRKQAKAKLLATLDEIARRDTVKDDLDPVKNWTDYAALRGQIANAGADDTAVKALEETFAESHASQFKTSTISSGWKTPERMRFDSMGRLLLGKVTESLVSLHDFKAQPAHTGTRDPRLAAARRAQTQGKYAEVKASLRDWLHFELAQSRMKAALAEKDPLQAHATLQTAAQALAAIENHDARDLFSTDARKQVEATKLAKASTIGERERYTMTNAGPTALGGVVNAFGATAGLALNIEKDIAASHGIHPQAKFGDQNDARLLVQGSAPVTAPYSAAERARFQKTGMSKLVNTLEREGGPVVLKAELPAPNAMLIDLSDRHSDAALDKLIAAIEASNDIPDEIAISIGGAKLASAKLSGTTGHYDWRYRNAPFATKAKFVASQAKMFADSVRVSVASPVAQTVAQIPLATTRRAVDHGNQMSAGVRERLTDLATRQSTNDEAPPAVPVQSESAPQTHEPANADTPATAPEHEAAHADTPATAETAETTEPMRADAPSAPQTHEVAHADAPSTPQTPQTQEEAPVDAPVTPTRDPRVAALALADIPELGQSGRSAQGATPAARPEAAFRPRPVQVTPAASEPEANRALQDQRSMMMGAGRDETLQWFAQRGIGAAYNSGHGMDCLIISLLQHATGRYDTQSEPELAARAAGYRARLAQTYPEIEQGDRMLYDDEPAIEALIRAINQDHQVDMNVQLVTPSADGPVRFQPSALGSEPVGVVMFGNHFQAVHLLQEETPQARSASAPAPNEASAAAPPVSARDAHGDDMQAEQDGQAQDVKAAKESTEAAEAKTAPIPRDGTATQAASPSKETPGAQPPRRSSQSVTKRIRNWVAGAAGKQAVQRPSGAPQRAAERAAGLGNTDDQAVRPPRRSAQRAAERVGDGLESTDDHVVQPPKRNPQRAAKRVENWLEATDGHVVQPPKRNPQRAAKRVEEWLEATADHTVRPPRRNAQRAAERGENGLEATEDHAVRPPRRNPRRAQAAVENWLEDTVEHAVRPPRRNPQRTQERVGEWLNALPEELEPVSRPVTLGEVLELDKKR
jgi:hypothetical protein